jgi:hypothetical protein
VNPAWITYGFGILLFVFLVRVAYRLHRDAQRQDFDLTELWIEDGHVSLFRIAFIVSLTLTSWLVIHLTLTAKLTEGYLGIYAAQWIAPIVAKLLAERGTKT